MSTTRFSFGLVRCPPKLVLISKNRLAKSPPVQRSHTILNFCPFRSRYTGCGKSLRTANFTVLTKWKMGGSAGANRRSVVPGCWTGQHVFPVSSSLLHSFESLFPAAGSSQNRFSAPDFPMGLFAGKSPRTAVVLKNRILCAEKRTVPLQEAPN